MSTRQLQRWIVRLHYDPGLTDAILGGDGPEDLSDAERKMLLAVDRRTWGLDGRLRGETLTALVEEYPCSVALRGLAGLDGFFSSDHFHQAVARDTPLALAFGAWLNSDMARLEGAIARARRRFVASADGEGADVVPIAIALGTLDLMAELHERLDDDLGNLGDLDLSDLLEAGEGVEYLLIEPDEDGQPVITESSAELHAALTSRATGTLELGALAIDTEEEDSETVEIVIDDDGLVN